jgi:exonuclease SbcC
LGVDSSVFRHVVHVAQGKFADTLEETQERKNSLDKLFRISQLENTYQELGRQEAPIQQIETRKHARLEKKSGLETAASRLGEEQANLDKIVQERQQKQIQLEEATKERDKLEQASKQNTETLSKLDAVEEKLRNTDATLQNAKTQADTIISKLHLTLSQEDWERIQKQTSAETSAHLGMMNSSLHGLKAEEESLNGNHMESVKQSAATQSEINLAEDERNTTAEQIAAIQRYLNGKGEQPEIQCDKCGTILTKDQWAKHIGEEEKELQDLQRRIAELNRRLEAEKTLVNQYKERLESIRSDSDKLKGAALLVEQLATQRQELEKGATIRTEFSQRKSNLVVELRALLHAEPASPDDEVTDQARSLQQKLETLSSQARNLEGELRRYDEYHLNPQKKRVCDAEEAASQLKKLEPEIKLDEKKVAMLQIIRTALREIQPAVRRSFVSRITQSANDYLKRLYAGAEIESFELNEDYEFLVTRAGHERHANRLSGGQQVLASMAFLLALSEVLSQLDFLILDEPTTHLDENRRKELVTVLEKLRRVPQLIIVDHHSELLEAADTRFRVTLDSDGKSHVEQIVA